MAYTHTPGQCRRLDHTHRGITYDVGLATHGRGTLAVPVGHVSVGILDLQGSHEGKCCARAQAGWAPCFFF